MNIEVIYKDGELEIPVEINSDRDTVWLRVEEMTELFDRDRSVIQRHIRNILKKVSLIRIELVQNLHEFKMKAEEM